MTQVNVIALTVWSEAVFDEMSLIVCGLDKLMSWSTFDQGRRSSLETNGKKPLISDLKWQKCYDVLHVAVTGHTRPFAHWHTQKPVMTGDANDCANQRLTQWLSGISGRQIRLNHARSWNRSEQLGKQRVYTLEKNSVTHQ